MRVFQGSKGAAAEQQLLRALHAGRRALATLRQLAYPTGVAEISPTSEAERRDTAPAGVRRVEARLRDSELFLLALALCAGGAAGISVILIDQLLDWVRLAAFVVRPEQHVSDVELSQTRVLLMPILGGLVVGVTAMLLRRWRPREVVDAIEANALFGGRMSVGDSLGLVAVTVLSGGFGASVGLEAAYTQLGAALASRFGRWAELRRDDVRTLVGCGAAGAIAAAFNAPLTGAFYAFELIIGTYTLQTLAPVGVAALTGALVVRGLVGSNPIFVIGHEVTIAAPDYFAFFGLGLAAAGLGILIMKGVTWTEALFRWQAAPRWARPVVGGGVIGSLAFFFPQILGSGHGGILHLVHSGFELRYLAGLIVAKITASAVSIGSGFRGGLFSTSLFLGSLFGSLIGALLTGLVPHLASDPLIYTLVGMGAVAAAIVGAPITMIMIVLETTGDFKATIGVMVGVVTAAMAVRHWFGYSFATWRFHLRGLTIRSPEDVGWINELLVGPMMRRDPSVIAAELPIDELRRRFPMGSTKQVFVVDEDGRLNGVLDPTEGTGPELADTGRTVGELVAKPAAFLLPGDNLRTALDRFSRAAQEILAVVDNKEDRRIIGYLSEAYALRRYAHELERRRGGRPDDAGIFSPAAKDAPR
ncbi:MAG: chloride channel protein [Alphaproteobacteria bacterium]|nr:chloride channel protein [Alphaproteobacteria bacterium]